MRKLLLAIGISLSATGCFSAGGFQTGDSGYVLLQGDEAGIRAFFDGQNGLITNGKSSPDIKSAHYEMRGAQEMGITKRAYAPGFFQKLFGVQEGK